MRQVLVGSLRRHPVSSLFPRSRRFSSIQDESAPTPPKAELGQQTLAKDFSSASEEEVDRALGALQ